MSLSGRSAIAIGERAAKIERDGRFLLGVVAMELFSWSHELGVCVGGYDGRESI